MAWDGNGSAAPVGLNIYWLVYPQLKLRAIVGCASGAGGDRLKGGTPNDWRFQISNLRFEIGEAGIQ